MLHQARTRFRRLGAREIRHPDAGRVREEADAYHRNLLANFGLPPSAPPSCGCAMARQCRISVACAPPGSLFRLICETLEGGFPHYHGRD